MKIVWTEPAVSDLENIQQYISKDSPYYASRLIEKIIHSVDLLETFPQLGHKVVETLEERIREILFQNYRIIYRLENEEILILSIIHTGRDLNNLEPKPWDIL